MTTVPNKPQGIDHAPSIFVAHVTEAALMTAIMHTAAVEAAHLNRHIENVAKTGADELLLASLQTRLDAIWNRHRQAELRLSTLENEQARNANIRVISEHGERAEIVITYMVDSVRKVSFTRHVHWDGSAWIGRSVLTDRRVRYVLPMATVQEAA